MDPVSGNKAQNRQVHGALSLHVDDLLMTSEGVFEKRKSWDDLERIFRSVPKTRMLAFSWGNVSSGSVTTSMFGVSMSIRKLPCDRL